MENTGHERRTQIRTVDLNDPEIFLQFTLKDKKFRFNLLDKSQDGMGMLVINEEADVLTELKIGKKLNMEYRTPQDSINLNFTINHITPIRKGAFKGDHQVGLFLFSKL